MENRLRTSILDSDVLAAWRNTMTSQNPDLLPEIVHQGDDLLSRFAAYYIQLRALPRRVRRALQRHWRLPLAGVALMLALGQSPAIAATIPVGGNCTLIDAITAANTDSATGGCPAGNGADTIVLPQGSTHTLTAVHNDTYGSTGLPVINSAIMIEGQGSVITRENAAPDFRILAVNSTGHLTFNETTVTGGVAPSGIGIGGGMYIRGGTAVLMNITVSGNTAFGRCAEGTCGGGRGGGIGMIGGSLNLTHSTVSGNLTTEPCRPDYSPYCYGSRGGGIYTRNGFVNNVFDYSIVTLTVLNSIIIGNKGDGLVSDGILTIAESIISKNDGLGVGSTDDSFGPVSTATIVDTAIYGNGFGLSGGGSTSVSNSIISRNRYDGVAGAGTTMTIANSTISDNGGSGLFGCCEVAVLNSTITRNGGAGANSINYLTVRDSIISENRYGAVQVASTLTLSKTLITGNGPTSLYGNSVTNYFGIVNITYSAITDNLGKGIGNSGGTVAVTNSTISGNSLGGISNSYGTVILLNSTITGNTSSYGGGVYNNGTIILAHTLLSGNFAPTRSKSYNRAPNGTVIANNHNLFGVNGDAGVVGFTPGLTDIVPAAGVQLNDILNPILAFNGGPTPTHALAPGSPAIDGGGPVCADANRNPLVTDQRGKPRTVDGNREGTARCDIGAFEFFPIVNNLVTLDPGLDTSFDPTSIADAPAGTFTIGTTFTNTSSTALRFPFFTVKELSGGNLLLNAEERARGVGATVTPDVGDQVFSPGETVQVDFVIGLQTSTPFTFFVDLFAEPVVSPASTAQRRPSSVTKKVMR
jgi:hypothetical protein